MADYELDLRIRRILAIRSELQVLSSRMQPGATAGSVAIWILSGGLGAAGLALAVPSGGVSLLLSVAGMVLFLIDMARQVQSGARTREERQRAQALEQELRDHLDFIRRFRQT